MKVYFSDALREALRDLRADANTSLADLASAAGVGESVFRRLENGEASPQIDSMDRYLGAYVDRTGNSLKAILERAAELEEELQRDSPEAVLERELGDGLRQADSTGHHSEA